ncbi:MAG TPA: hypothetical protein VFO10_25495 [Oligoflexus sp.]|uniref:hypothetical protein n=1 Tax=Oligoflexus sp. TaxID=1971216 RepID=UPI002D7E448E|nr:hypothetical protein [Oligoflexus sp.]HET9240643.1 hypothetical protein [Oligoflexus sp.]
MISYLGVTFDELLQAFEDSFAFSDDRPDRLLEEPIEVSEADEDEESDADEDIEVEEFEDDEDVDGLMIDEQGQLHAYGESVPDAAENALAFLTDYIVADEMNEQWLPLNEARGAVLALQSLLEELDEIPEVDCAYHFVISRAETTGYPDFVTMRPLNGESAPAESLTRTDKAYEGVVNDNTALTELFAKADVPEDEQELLADVISEAVAALAEEQCGVVFDVKAFCRSLTEMAAAHRGEGIQL